MTFGPHFDKNMVTWILLHIDPNAHALLKQGLNNSWVWVCAK